MRWPLQQQILVPTALVIAAAFLAVAIAQAWVAVDAVERAIEARLIGVAQTLDSTNIPLRDPVLQQMKGLTGAEFAAATPQGELLARSSEFVSLIDNPPAVHEPEALRLSTANTYLEEKYFGAVARLERQSAGGDPVVLHAFYPVSAWREARRQAVLPTLVIGGIALLCLIGLVFVIARRVASPLQRLTAQVNEIAGGMYEPMDELPRNDEIRDLATAVNQMAAKLSDYQQQVRKIERLRTLGQLGGGVAHHLRNAATGCKLALDFHQNDCPVDDEENFQVAIRQLTIMEDYLQRFLQLGNPNKSPQLEVVDVADVLQSIVELLRPLANHRKVALQWSPPDERLLARCDRHDLTQSLTNIAINAIEAASEGTSRTEAIVALAVTRQDQTVRVEVTDTGDGPPAGEDIYEPLVSHKADGAGLGLAVAKSFAEGCNGSIFHERRNDRTVFVLEIPVADSNT